MSEELELFKVHRAGQEKYTYFLLAAAGAAIGFSVTQTKNDALNWAHVLLFFAILFWAASFFCGCIRLQYVDSGLYANIHFIKLKNAGFSRIGTDEFLHPFTSDGIERAIEYNSNQAARYGKMHFNLVMLGALFFIFWHVYEMYLRSIK